MKTMTVEQFKSFLRETEWNRSQDIEVLDTTEICKRYDDHGEPVMADSDYGIGSITWKAEGVEITYQEGFQYELYEPDTFETSTEGSMEPWVLSGVTVEDEDYDGEIWEILNDELDAAIDYSEVTDHIAETTDLTPDNDGERITVEVDNEPDLSFVGQQLAYDCTDWISGELYEYTLYQTAKGKYVCERNFITQWQGQSDRNDAIVCDTLTEVCEFFGDSEITDDFLANIEL